VQVLSASERSLEKQMKILAGAEAYVGSYGDLAVLASYSGVPAYAFDAEPEPPVVQSLLSEVERAGWGRITLQLVEKAPQFTLPATVTREGRPASAEADGRVPVA
jgi:hypothetical protein